MGKNNNNQPTNHTHKSPPPPPKKKKTKKESHHKTEQQTKTAPTKKSEGKFRIMKKVHQNAVTQQNSCTKVMVRDEALSILTWMHSSQDWSEHLYVKL